MLMKFTSIILSLVILVFSIKVCSDENSTEAQNHEEISAAHNNQNDIYDSCPITCACNCCGMTITYQPLQTFELEINNSISTEIVSVYKSMYRFNFHSNIWQPPQLIS